MNLLRSALTTIFIHIHYLHVFRLQFVPLILSMIVCLTQLCRKSANKEDNRKTKISTILSKFEFLWQLPYIQLIRHFILWNDLRKAVLKKQKIYKLCNVKGMALLRIIRTTKLATFQSWHINDIRQELEKTALSKKAVIFILKVRLCLY